MEIGMIGLGRMGGSMAQRLLKGGHRVVAYDLRPEAVKELESEGAAGASSLADLAGQLTAPRAVWVMAPAGEPTERTLTALAGALSEGDIIIIPAGTPHYFSEVPELIVYTIVRIDPHRN